MHTVQPLILLREGPTISLTKNLGMNTRVEDADIKF
jgi:hypothetical protein